MVTKLFVVLLASMLLTACSIPGIAGLVGSGRSVTHTFDLSDFTEVEIANAFNAVIVMDDGYSVEVTVDDNLVDFLRVEQTGDTLHIGLDADAPPIIRPTLQARVSMPSLARLDASGASRLEVTGFTSSDEVTMNVSGASTALGDTAAGALVVDASGASTVILQGSAATLDATASGASNVNLSDFPVTDATVNANGASVIHVNASGALSAEASGASTVRYAGGPTLEQSNATGSSTISPE